VPTLQRTVSSLQFAGLDLQFLDAVIVAPGDGAGRRSRFTDPVARGRRGTADLAGDGLDGCSLGGVGFPNP